MGYLSTRRRRDVGTAPRNDRYPDRQNTELVCAVARDVGDTISGPLKVDHADIAELVEPSRRSCKCRAILWGAQTAIMRQCPRDLPTRGSGDRGEPLRGY